MIVIVFRTQLREDVSPDVEVVGLRMYEIASSMPGFVSYKDFAAEDGEYVSIVEFESLESLDAWRNHPEHREAQQRGREEFFTSYHIQVCTTVRDYSFEYEKPSEA